MVAAYETPDAFRVNATASDTPTVTATKPRITTTPPGSSRSLRGWALRTARNTTRPVVVSTPVTNTAVPIPTARPCRVSTAAANATCASRALPKDRRRLTANVVGIGTRPSARSSAAQMADRCSLLVAHQLQSTPMKGEVGRSRRGRLGPEPPQGGLRPDRLPESASGLPVARRPRLGLVVFIEARASQPPPRSAEPPDGVGVPVSPAFAHLVSFAQGLIHACGTPEPMPPTPRASIQQRRQRQQNDRYGDPKPSHRTSLPALA
jgi:hypothetical protein